MTHCRASGTLWVMNEIPVLLVREGTSITVLLGFDVAECHAAAAALAARWGAPPGSLRTPAGQLLEVGRAEGLVAPYLEALVALDESGAVIAIGLADDRPSAAFLAREWGSGADEVRILPAGTVDDIFNMPAGRDPRLVSDSFCPRCQDMLLHVDPIFDDTSRLDGQRICNACGTLEALKLDREGRRD